MRNFPFVSQKASIQNSVSEMIMQLKNHRCLKEAWVFQREHLHLFIGLDRFLCCECSMRLHGSCNSTVVQRKHTSNTQFSLSSNMKNAG